MSRKIDREILAAILARKSAIIGNSAVVRYSGLADTDVILHGHTIAVVSDKADKVRFSLAGWPTATTRRRINAVLGCLCGVGVGVYQKDGVQYLRTADGSSNPIDDGLFYELPMVGDYNRENRERYALVARHAAERELDVPQTPFIDYHGNTYGEG